MSEQPPDKLVEISSVEWTTLRDMYLRDWPTHMVGFYTVDNYVQWNKIKSDINNLNIYSLNGDWQRDGTFVVVDRYQVFLNTLNKDSIECISRALVLLDWSYGLLFHSLLDRYLPAVLQALNSKQLTIAAENKCAVYYMSRVEAAALDVVCPDGISQRPMSEEHAGIVDEVWPRRHPGSLFLLRRLINWNFNVGAFTDDGKLVAWCFRSQTGPLAVIQVDSNHKQRGLGTFITKIMTKKLSASDIDSFAVVSLNNVASRCMFEKIGYKMVDYCHFLQTDPLVVSDWNYLDRN